MLKNIELDRSLVVLDLETTGRRAQVDRIVEISTLKLKPDGTSKLLTRRLNPGMPIHPEATAVHGITDADVANEAPFEVIAERLEGYLNGCDLCGYNIWSFDLKILIAEFRRVGRTLPMQGRRIIDPMRIFHKREPRDLTAAMRFYRGMEHEGAHKADADVLAALLVLDGQADRYDDLPRTVAELHEYMDYPDVVDPDGKFVRRDDGAIVVAFGKYNGEPLAVVARSDPAYLAWIIKADFSPEAKSAAQTALATAQHVARPT
jgi:DNA polymerase III subunit epsilon